MTSAGPDASVVPVPALAGGRGVDGFAEVCDALGDDLGWALGVAFRAYRKAAAEVFEDLPGGSRGYQVLRASTEGAPATQLALAQQLGIDRTVMTYLLDDLEAAGLVVRRADPTDRRARRVVATDEGRQRLAALTGRLHAVEERLLSPLPADDAETFRALLQRLATHADRLDHVSPCTVAEDLAEEAADDADASGARRHTSRRA